MLPEYTVDPKFFNEDGSFNVESAMAAGRKAHSQAAHQGGKVAVQAFHDTRHAIGNVRARFSLFR